MKIKLSAALVEQIIHLEIDLIDLQNLFEASCKADYPEEINWIVWVDIFCEKYPELCEQGHNDGPARIYYNDKTWSGPNCISFFKSLFRDIKLKEVGIY